jgi:cytochrome oxidase assembly protein ShyY1
MLRRLVLSRPIATAATMIVCSVGLSLGFWQLDRMQQKLTLAADIAKKEESRPLLANNKDWQLDEVKNHRMIARGVYLADQSVWLENRPHPQGRDPKTGISTGFLVMTPLKLEDSQKLLWINRGWAPRNAMDREALPSISIPSGLVQVEGLAFEYPARVMSMGTQGSSAESQKIQQNLDIQKQSKYLGFDYLPFILREVAATNNDGLQRDWPSMTTGVEKHQGYAFQWFALTVFALLFWLITGILRKKIDE